MSRTNGVVFFTQAKCGGVWVSAQVAGSGAPGVTVGRCSLVLFVSFR